jgi:SHS2 domain-containing protein
MKRFEVIEHTADTGIRAFGKDLKEVFENAAYGMLSLVADLSKVQEKESRDVAVEAEDREELLVEWLNELLYLLEVDGLIFKSFKIGEIDDHHLKAKVFGELVDREKHDLGIDIKAVTYHMLKVARTDNAWETQVIFDV